MWGKLGKQLKVRKFEKKTHRTNNEEGLAHSRENGIEKQQTQRGGGGDGKKKKD